MKIAVRRTLALGGVATTSALIAGLLIAPSASAGAGDLRVLPAGVENNATAAALTFSGRDANFAGGGTATFTRVGASATFTATIAETGIPDSEGGSTENFADEGNGVGSDGPADAGSYNVSVQGQSPAVPGAPRMNVGGSDSCTGCFTVLAAAPVAVTSVAPSSARPGSSANGSIAGNGFERGSKISFVKDGFVVAATVVNADGPPLEEDPVTGDLEPVTNGITTRTALQRRFVVGAAAAAGAYDVRVTNLDGTSATCSACFFVAGADLTSVTPVSAAFNDPGQGDIALTFRGTSVANGDMRLEYQGTQVGTSRNNLALLETNPAASNAGNGEITGTFNLSDAAPGTYQPVVRTADGIVNACTCRFSVTQRSTRLPPTVTSVDRTGAATGKTQAQGTTETFDITGTNFSKGALVTVSGTGVTTTAVDFVSQNVLRATFSAGSGATTGNRTVTVTLANNTGSGASPNDAYVITAGSPTSSPSASPSPSSSATATATVSGRYVGLGSPVRVLDTRNGGAPRRTGLITLDLSSQISDSQATAAVLNVTVTNGTRRGFLVAYPDGTTKPGTSNVNFEGQRAATGSTPASAGTQANEVVVRLPANRRVSLFVDSASAHVIADLVGSFTAANTGGRVITQAPVRALDTRDTSTPTRRGEVVLDLSNRLPATSTAAILNVTVTRTAGRGFVTVYPTGTTRPGTSNVNFERGQTQANEVTTQVGTGANAGRVSLFVDSANASLVVDVVGAVTAQAVNGTQVFTALASPVRAIDTRDNRGARRSGNVNVQMPSSVPSNATGVVLNVTATNGTRAGFVTIFPAGSSNPGTSNVNFPTNLTQANEVVSALGTNRSIIAFVGGGGSPSAHVIVDVVGYLTPQSASSASSSASPSSSAGGGILPIP